MQNLTVACFSIFHFYHCVQLNKTFVPHKHRQTHSAQPLNTLLSRQTKQTIFLYEWFPITFEQQANWGEETVADEKCVSGCQVQWRALFAYQRSAIMSRAMHTLC